MNSQYGHEDVHHREAALNEEEVLARQPTLRPQIGDQNHGDQHHQSVHPQDTTELSKYELTRGEIGRQQQIEGLAVAFGRHGGDRQSVYDDQTEQDQRSEPPGE